MHSCVISLARHAKDNKNEYKTKPFGTTVNNTDKTVCSRNTDIGTTVGEREEKKNHLLLRAAGPLQRVLIETSGYRKKYAVIYFSVFQRTPFDICVFLSKTAGEKRGKKFVR